MSLGSVKSNIGHLEVAAGVVGLIKTILCLKNKAIPATLHFTSPNPELRLDETPFTVQSRIRPMGMGRRAQGRGQLIRGGRHQRARRRRRGAGSSGTRRAARPPGAAAVGENHAALEESRTALAAALADPDGPDLSDVAFTLAGRRKHNIAMAAVVHDREHAASVLRASEHDNVFVGESAGDNVESAAERVVFMFPGQGAQHVGMARGLYDTEPVFAEHFDTCAAGFRNEMGIDLHAEVFGDARYGFGAY